MKNKGRRVVVSVGLFLLITTIGGLLLKGIIDTALYNRFPDRGVPRINIDLNGVSLSEINEGTKDVKYEGNGLQIYNDSKISEYGGVEIKGRGNGTWTQEKKPYQIKFEDKVDMFGMGKARKWYLLANHADATHIRNEIAFNLERILDMDYSFRGSFVELYINGEYEGLYYLTNAVEINKNSIDLKDPMGIMVELDNLYGFMESSYTSGNGDLLVVKGVVSDYNKEEATVQFLESYNNLEGAVLKKDYEEIKELIDVESWADYYLLSEFSVNPDAYWTSFYLYKDGINDKIHAGPGWDFDLAFANKNWGIYWIGDRFYSPEETMIRKQEYQLKEKLKDELGDDAYNRSGLLSRIMFDLVEIPDFDEVVRSEYQKKMSGRKEELVVHIGTSADKISRAALNNNEKWNKEDYWAEINILIDWVEKRYDYLEQEYGISEENPTRFL